MPINNNQTNNVIAWYEAAKDDCIRPYLAKPSLFSDMQSYLALFDDKKTFEEIKNVPPGVQRINEVCKNNLLGLTDTQKIAFYEAARSIYLYDEPNEIYFNAKDYAYRIIQKITSELLVDSHWLEAKTRCKAPYRDLIWMLSSPSELMLADIDTACRQAINQLDEEEKKDFCREAAYVKSDNQESYLEPYLEHAHHVIVDATCKNTTDTSMTDMNADYTEELNEVLETISLSNATREINDTAKVLTTPLGVNRSEPYVSKWIGESEFLGIGNQEKPTQSSAALILGATGATVGVAALFGVGFWAIKKFKCFLSSDQHKIQNDEMISLQSRKFSV